MLEIPSFQNCTQQPQNPFRCEPLDEKTVKVWELSLKSQSERRRRTRMSFRSGMLVVVAGGIEVVQFNPAVRPQITFTVKVGTCYLDIVGRRDGEEDVLLAVFPLEPPAGDERTHQAVRLEGKQKLQLFTSLARGEDHELKCEVRAEMSSALPLFTGWHAVLARRSALALLGLNIAQAAVLLFLGGRDYERRTTLRREVRLAIDASYRDAAELMALMAGPLSRLEDRAQAIRVIPAVAYGESYPYPVLSNPRGDTESASRLAEGLHAFPDLRPDYERSLVTWSVVFRDLGDVLVRKAKIPEAIQVFEYLRTQTNTSDLGILYALGELYKLTDGHRKAIEVYEWMIRRGLANVDPRPWHFAGWSFFELGDFEQALRHYDKALAVFQQAVREYKGKRKPYSDYAKIYYNKALLYARMPGLEDAARKQLVAENIQRALNIALEASPEVRDENPRVSFTLALLYTKKGELEPLLEVRKRDWDGALKYLEAAIRRERTYIVRAEKDPAFSTFRDKKNQPYQKHFSDLLEHYRPAAEDGFGPRLEAVFDPTIFSE